MKKLLTRLAALILVFTMMLEPGLFLVDAATELMDSVNTKEDSLEALLSQEEDGTNYTAADDEESSGEEEEAYVICEDASIRTENVKHYIMSDHSKVAAVYADPVHYKLDDNWIDINNELIPVGEGRDGKDFGGFRTRSNSFELRFAEEGDQQSFVSLTEDEYKVSFSPIYQPETYI